jgi:hypothetical protein
MRVPRFALVLTFAAIATMGSGCVGVGTDGSWPPGTEAIVSAGSAQVLAHVPIGQRIQTGGRRSVPITNGTRIVCLDGLRHVSSIPYMSDPSILASLVRVKPLSGAYTGVEVALQRAALSLQPQPDRFWVIVLVVAWVCVSVAMALSETCADELRTRCRLNRRGADAYHGNKSAGRLRSRLMRPADLRRHADDDARWLAWIASHNARTKSRERLNEPRRSLQEPNC